MNMRFFPGNEFFFDKKISAIGRLYCLFFGAPILGLRIRWRRLSKLLPPKASMILDAGCGRGVISRELARLFKYATIDALDRDSHAQVNNRYLADAVGLSNCNFIVQDLIDIHCEGKYDLIVSVDNLEHLKDDRCVLNKFFVAMKCDGVILIHVPHYYRRWPIFKWRKNFKVPGHVRCGYHQAEIVERVRRAGFVIEKTGFSYGFLENLVNNIGYFITGAEEKNPYFYAMVFPLLNLISWLGQFSSPCFGAGVWVVGRKVNV